MKKQKILIVDDQEINRMLLMKILENRYTILQAENGLEAWNIVEKEKDSIQAILLDLIMPVMDGYAFLDKIKKSSYAEIPVIVASQDGGEESELRALKIGAVDFIAKPYHPAIISQRLLNTIAMRENAILKNTSERDFLTKLYNKETFFEKVATLIQEDQKTTYSLIYFDIESFKVVNDFFGEQKGDELLIYLADTVRTFSQNSNYLGARLTADCYCVCMPHDRENELRFANFVMSFLENFPISLKLKMNFGVFVIEDVTMSVSVMCDRANLALKNIVGKYDTFIEYYNSSLHEKIIEEQEIVNEMNTALQERQFVVYVQPKFDLNTFSTIGVETLVRWKHPEKGLIPPIKFIPVFEKNGFIVELDMFVFEEVCKTIRSLLDKGVPIVPFSVNLSRADIYRPNLCEVITGIMAKNKLDHSLIEFEITETSYTQDSDQLIFVVNRLRDLGFSISMDDFGTGYSSLNMLTEVPVDLLKIDMRFLKNFNEADEKSKNIIHFIVYMAKWLNLPVIAEGVETIEQVEYLRSIGCYNGQGYFFSKPFPIEEYEERINKIGSAMTTSSNQDEIVPIKDLCSGNSTFNQIFNLFTSPLAIMELRGDNLEILRVNKYFYNEIMENSQKFIVTTCHALDLIVPEDRERALAEFKKLDAENPRAELVVRVQSPHTGMIFWNRACISYLQQTYNSSILIMQLRNITEEKNKELISDLQEERLNAVLEYSKSAIIDVNLVDRKLRINTILAKALGMDKLVFDYINEVKENYSFPFEQKQEFLGMLDDIFAGKAQEKPLLVSFIRHVSNRAWYKLSYKVFPENSKKPQLAVIYFENVTHSVINKEIYEREQEFRDSIIASDTNYMEIDIEEKSVLRHSPKFLGSVGYSRGHSVDEFFARIGNMLIHPDDKERFTQLMNIYSMNLLCSQNKKMCFDFRYLTGKDFKWVCFNLSLIKNPTDKKTTGFCYLDELGATHHYLDIEDLRSKRDIATGLYPEDIFEKAVNNYFDVFSDKFGALFYISLSKEFSASSCPKKESNYSVVAMSNILRQIFRNSNIVARINEFDFVVLMENVSDKNIALQKANEVCNAMNEYNKKDFSDKIVGNIGVILLKEQNTYNIVIKKARTACEKAMQQGKNTLYLDE